MTLCIFAFRWTSLLIRSLFRVSQQTWGREHAKLFCTIKTLGNFLVWTKCINPKGGINPQRSPLAPGSLGLWPTPHGGACWATRGRPTPSPTSSQPLVPPWASSCLTSLTGPVPSMVTFCSGLAGCWMVPRSLLSCCLHCVAGWPAVAPVRTVRPVDGRVVAHVLSLTPLGPKRTKAGVT